MQTTKNGAGIKWVIAGSSVLAIGAMLYGGLLFMSPAIPRLAQDITPTVMAQPMEGDSKLILPQINIVIPVSSDSSMKSGGWWQNANQGNPKDGGPVTVIAKKFSLQPTPSQTVQQSPFYNLAKLKQGDKIVFDYKGIRYGYQVTENASGIKDLLTLKAADDKDLTVVAKPLGPVTVKQ